MVATPRSDAAESGIEGSWGEVDGNKSCITDVQGIQVGHFTDDRRPTGCTAVIALRGAVASVDVRGGAPGTRETDLLAPTSLVQEVHAVVLAGGSAWGLDAASGVMRWLEERGAGLPIGVGRLPIVPAAVLFDLQVGDMQVRPDAAAGYAACDAALSSPCSEGNVGAGAGAALGKIFGIARAMKGGVGSASVRVGNTTVGALVACNALGDVIDPNTGRILAGARTADGLSLLGSADAMLRGELPQPLLAGTNTTLAVIATDAVLTKVQVHRLAQAAHDGLARSINPVHTLSDGDTVFALSTGCGEPATTQPGMMVLSAMAAAATAAAVVRAVLAAKSIRIGSLELPSATEMAMAQSRQGSP